jgi:hypothetical protein
MRPILATLLALLFSLACRPATKSPVLAPDQISAASTVSDSDSGDALRLEIQPAAESSPGGWRLPLRFTIRNTGNQPVRACLSGARVVHLWELDRDYGYTLTQQRTEQPGCEEPFDLQSQGTHSWTEEITVPQIAAGSVRLVGFTQVVAAEPCAASGCEPTWLTASFSPFKIEEGGGARQARMLDLRTNVTSADLAGPSPIDLVGRADSGGGER